MRARARPILRIAIAENGGPSQRIAFNQTFKKIVDIFYTLLSHYSTNQYTLNNYLISEICNRSGIDIVIKTHSIFQSSAVLE